MNQQTQSIIQLIMDTIEKGVYEAYQGNSGVCVAMDEYNISRTSSGFLVESNNTIFGSNGFQQKAVLRTNSHWQMQELRVIVESLGIEMYAFIKERKLYLQQKQQDTNIEKIIDLQSNNYFFMYNGALVVPIIWLRGVDFENYDKVTYQMLPMGYAEVKQLYSSASFGQNMRNFSLLMYVQNFTSIVKIQTDMSGKLSFFHDEANQLIIKTRSF